MTFPQICLLMLAALALAPVLFAALVYLLTHLSPLLLLLLLALLTLRR